FGQPVQAAAVVELHTEAPLPGQRDDFVNGAARRPFGNEKPLHGPAGPQRLQHRVAARDDARLRRHGVAPLPPSSGAELPDPKEPGGRAPSWSPRVPSSPRAPSAPWSSSAMAWSASASTSRSRSQRPV